ncbi:MAG: hypothetical protein HY516_01905 [Candidatus Aenigmarchaeota archaeon]|nr:hypothetical protein [Candidatus Aenigmarchaeota archaeon]
MKLGFVASLVDAEEGWILNTAKKFSEHTDHVVFELHQEHGWLKKAGLQAKRKKAVSKTLNEFCEPAFGLHIPWEPKKSYRAIDKGFTDKHVISWLRFCADNGIEFANMHIEWGDGVPADEWKNDPAVRSGYVETAADNLENVFSFAESNDIKLSLEIITSCLYVEKYGKEFVHFPAFPADYLKLQKISGFKFGINPDVCHASITWWNMRNGIKAGIYDEDLVWQNMGMEEFLEKMVKASQPMHQIHLADFGGYRSTSEHAIALGTGLLTDNAIKTVLDSIGKKTALILEIKEDWKTKENIRKCGYLPETIRSLEKLSGFGKLFK